MECDINEKSAHSSQRNSWVCEVIFGWELWNVSSGEELQLWEGHKNEVFAVAYDAATEQIASGSQDRTIRVWK